MIESQLREVSSKLGHFPSCSELRQLGLNDLMCATTKRGGVIAWASRLGIARQLSNSDTGWQGERAVADILSRRGFSVTVRSHTRSPYDLIVEGIARIDVKTAKFAAYGEGDRVTGWFYRMGKEPTCDFVILHQADTGTCLVVPWQFIPTTNVTISRGGGKYARFTNNFELLRAFVARNQN